VVFGKYLPLGLVGMKVKGWHNHLHDEMQYFHQISSFNDATWIICRNLSFGLATKARAYKVVGQERSPGVKESAKE